MNANMKLLLWVILAFYCLFNQACCVKVLKFTDNRADDTGAKIIPSSTQNINLTDFTFCFDVFVTLVRKFNFLNSGSEDLMIQVPDTLDSFDIKFKGIWYIAYNDLVEPYNWGTFCLSYNTKDESITVAYKGILIFSKKDPLILGTRGLSSAFIPSLILGEKKSPYTMDGLITNFRMWSKPLGQMQLITISKCDGPLSKPVTGKPDLVDWETAKWDLGGVVTEQTSDVFPCDKVDKDVFNVLMPTAAENYFYAVETCVALGGIIPLPRNSEEVDLLQKIAERFIDKSTCYDYLWMPIRQSELDETAWYTEEEYEEETSPAWLEWQPGQPNGQDRQTCTGISVSGGNLLYDLPCTETSYCYMCRFEDITFFKFRGLCENLEDEMDQRYLIDTEVMVNSLEQGIVFTGYKRSRIMLDKTLNRWKVTSLFDEIPIITLAFEKDLPTGVTTWDIPDRICGDSQTERKLFLNSCNKTEFACHDGDCVPISHRCNGENDCNDETDEQRCQTLYWEDGNKDAYSEDIPPGPLNDDISKKLPVFVSAVVYALIDIKELEGIWQCKVEFELTWYDQRLFMQNLKDNDNLNILTEDERPEIWIPEVIFDNNDKSERMVLDENTLLIVNKIEEEGFPSSQRELDAAEIFLGELNPLLYRRTYSTKFDCSFNLRSYPFDTQECAMILKVPKYHADLVELVANNISYTGPTLLAQFEVVKTTLSNSKHPKFIMLFRRRYTYSLVSVYIPSMCLLLITVLTGFINNSHFEANIMVHLTTMLVMYTLFQAISISLPQTAYLKLLDVWLFFGLILPFIGFCLEVCEELIVSREEDNAEEHQMKSIRVSSARASVHPEKFSESEDTKGRLSPKRRLVQFLARVVLPILTIAFTLIYLIVCIYSYNNPTLEFD